MGTVWLLRRPAGAPCDTIYDELRAAKTFNAFEDDQEARIEQELGNWVSLQSQYVVPLIKIARMNFELAALMQLMPGSLADYMLFHKNKSFNDSVVKTVLLDVLRGLDYAHRERNLAHLDIKPANLLLASANSPHVKISDWGISRMMSQGHEYAQWLTAPSRLNGQSPEKTQFCGGTFPYMAPERFSTGWNISPTADIFSIGIIAVQLMTGRIPTAEDSNPFRSVSLIVSHEYFKRAKTLLARRGGPLVPVILKMIDPDPQRRFHHYTPLLNSVETI
jgi:serine/threonine protein kinase